MPLRDGGEGGANARRTASTGGDRGSGSTGWDVQRPPSPGWSSLPAVLLVVVLVGATGGVAFGVGLVVDGAAGQASPDGETPAPGARLAAVVGVGQAELEGELRTRALDLALSAAGSDNARAAIVAAQLDRMRERLDTLAARKVALKAAHANGTLAESVYRARIAALAAEIRATERVLNRTDAAAAALPDAVLAAHGLDPAVVETLRNHAGELRGGGIADIARSIAGPDAGSAVVGPSPPVAPDVAGPTGGDGPDNTSNTTADDG